MQNFDISKLLERFSVPESFKDVLKIDLILNDVTTFKIDTDYNQILFAIDAKL